MKLEHFHYLLKIDQLHSISAAARALHISQTTLSSIVNAAEAELGFPIFQRALQGVSTTASGQRFMELAWEIDVKYEELLSLKGCRETAQSIAIPMSPNVNTGLSVPLSLAYRRFELRGDLTLDECSSMEVYARICSRGANIGVTYLSDYEFQQIKEEAAGNGIETELLYEDRLYLLTAADHPLAAVPCVDICELRNERLAMVTSFQSELNQQFFKDLVLDCSAVFFPNITTMCHAVLEQGMVGLLTGYTICSNINYYKGNYRIIPINITGSAQRSSIYLIHRRDRSLRYQERVLLSCIKEYFVNFSAQLQSILGKSAERSGIK